MLTKTLIYIAGPTGVGKTKLSLEIAKLFDTDIISCDSRQFYKEMNIGTAVPSSKELKEVKHHLIQHKSIHEKYTVGDFEKEALQILDFLFKKKRFCNYGWRIWDVCRFFNVWIGLFP